VLEEKRYKLDIAWLWNQALLSAAVLAFSQANERVASLRLRVAGSKALTVVCAYAPNSSSEFPAFLESVGGVLERALPADSIVVLGDFNAHMGKDRETWRGDWEERLDRTESERCFVMDFCASHGLSRTHTVFEHKVAHTCIWYQNTLSRRSFGFVIVSSDLPPYVLDTRREEP